MSNLKRLMQIRNHNRSKSQSSEFESKVIKDGDNKYRIVDEYPHIAFEHWFTAADGTSVHSICTRNYENEMDEDVEHEVKYCRVCDLVKDAWDIWNDPSEYTEEEVFRAGVIIGRENDTKKGFPSSWGAKQFGYLNVIDRDDDWCAKNNHTKLLSKSDKQDGISAGDKGQLDELIDMVEEYGDWSDYDARMKRKGKKKDTTYRMYKGPEVELTEEEKAYAVYKFADKLKPTKDETLKRWLEVGVRKKADDDESKDEETDESPETETETEAKEEVEVEAKEEKKAPAKKAKAAKKVSSKKTSLKLKKKEPEPEPEEEMAECPHCSEMISVDSSACPHCGTEFEGHE